MVFVIIRPLLLKKSTNLVPFTFLLSGLWLPWSRDGFSSGQTRALKSPNTITWSLLLILVGCSSINCYEVYVSAYNFYFYHSFGNHAVSAFFLSSFSEIISKSSSYSSLVTTFFFCEPRIQHSCIFDFQCATFGLLHFWYHQKRNFIL